MSFAGRLDELLSKQLQQASCIFCVLELKFVSRQFDSEFVPYLVGEGDEPKFLVTMRKTTGETVVSTWRPVLSATIGTSTKDTRIEFGRRLCIEPYPGAQRV